MLLAGGQSQVFELAVQAEESLQLSIARSGADVILSWPAAIANVTLQSASSLSPPSFTDLNPQPALKTEQNLNRATLPIGAANTFYRLRK